MVPTIRALIVKTLPTAAALSTLLAMTFVANIAQASPITLTLKGNYADRSQVGYLEAFSDQTSNTVTASTGNAYLGSYQLTDGRWVFCLSPFTEATSPGNYNVVSLASFFGAGGGYALQFGNTAYSQLAPGYHAQNGLTVLNKVTSLYNWAYADSTVATTGYSVAEKSAGFAYALWEIEGESTAYSPTTGGLRLGGVDAAVQTYATRLLNDVTSNSWSGFSYQAYDFTMYQATPISTSQSFLTVTPSSINHNGIPEPSTVLLLAGAGVALFVTRRRSVRANY
jgi:hypothetical protein